MKKLFFTFMLALILFVFVIPVEAQIHWYPVNQTTVYWNAVTEDVDGDPIPSYATLRYKIYLVNAVTDPDRLNLIEVADIAAPTVEATISVPAKGQYYIGIDSILVYIDGSIDYAGINWADQPEDQGSVELWAIRRSAPPLKATELRR